MFFSASNIIDLGLIQAGQRCKQVTKSWNYRGMCSKPQETKPDPPAHGRISKTGSVFYLVFCLIHAQHYRSELRSNIEF